MKKREAIKTLMLVSLILVIVAVAGCGVVTPVQNPFIKVTSPKEGDVIDGKYDYIVISWAANDLRSQFVNIDFACAYNKGKGVQIGDWERIGSSISADDGYFLFGPNVASWILKTFGVIPDTCQVRVTESGSGFEPAFDHSGVFTVTFD